MRTLLAPALLLVACGEGAPPRPEIHLAQRSLTATGGLVTVSGLLPDWDAVGDAMLVERPQGRGLPVAELALRMWSATDRSPDASIAGDRAAAALATELFDGTRLGPTDHLEVAEELVEIAPRARAFTTRWDGEDDAGIAATVYVAQATTPANGPALHGFKCELVLHHRGELDYRGTWRELARHCAALAMRD